MGVLANGYRDNLGAFRTFGATISNNAYPSAHHWQLARTAAMRNLTAGQGITSDLVGIPSGNRHPSAWVMPQKAGALAARNALIGTGGVSAAELWAVKLAEAGLTGSGDLEAIGSLIVQALADLTGSGEISDANLQAFLAAVANLTGSGTAAGTATGLGALIAAITGSGTTAGSTATGIGELEADLVVTGTGLTTANVGQAVWAHLIDAGFTAEQVLKIIAAVSAGKSSGGPDSPVFRNLGDTQDVVAGVANSSGDRTSATYTPG